MYIYIYISGRFKHPNPRIRKHRRRRGPSTELAQWLGDDLEHEASPWSMPWTTLGAIQVVGGWYTQRKIPYSALLPKRFTLKNRG